MSDDAVQVKITANASGLDRGILTAKSSLQDLRTALTGVSAAVPATQAATESMKGLTVATAGASREFIVLGHEVLSGNFSRIPGSLLVLSQRMGGLQLATVGWLAGIAAVTYGLYEMIAGVEESEQATNLISNRMELAGKSFQDNDKFINQLVSSLRGLPGVSTAAAQSMAAELGGAARLSSQQINFLVENVGKFAHVSGEDVPSALKQMAAALEEPFSNYKKLDDQLNLFSVTQFKSIKDFQEQGNVAGAAGVVMEALGQRLGAVTDKTTPLEASTNRLKTSWDALNTSFGNSSALHWLVDTGLPKMVDLLADASKRLDYIYGASAGQTFKQFSQEQNDKQQVSQLPFKQDGGDEQSAQEKQSIKDMMDARKRASEEAIANKSSEISQERSLDEQYYDGQSETIKLAADQKKITLQQEFAQLQAALSQEWGLQSKSYDQQLALYAKDSAEFKKLQNEKLIALQKFHNDETKLQIQATNAQKQQDDKMASNWKSLTSSLQTSLTTAITGMVTGTKTLTQTMIGLFGSMVNMIIGKFVEIGIEWVGVQLGMLPATKATALANISASAGEAFSAAYASICAIPIVGPFMAPGVAAASGADALAGGVSLAAFDVGTSYVPSDGLAKLHTGEAVIPAGTAQKFREGDLGMGGGDSHTHFHINSLDSAGVAKMLQKHSGAIATAVASARRGGNGGLRAAFAKM